MEATAKVSNKVFNCSIVAQGKATPFKPGNARTAVPQWDKDRCIRCGICYLYCPHGAVYRDADGYFDVNKDLCSGCGVCHRECWFGVIGMVQED